MEEEEECWGSWSWQRKRAINGSISNAVKIVYMDILFISCPV